MVVHGSAPECFKLSTIEPIPKGRNTNSTDSANFHGIALSSIDGKLFDNIILERCHDKLVSCDLQFGFKAKSQLTRVHLFSRKRLHITFKIKALFFVRSWMHLKHSINCITVSYLSCLLNACGE
jgi:hypothetical protein